MSKEDPETQAAVKRAMASHAKLVIGDDANRQQMAMREVQNVLAKYNVALVPRCMISPMGIEFMIETQVIPPEEVAKREKKKQEEENARKAGQVSKKGKGQSGRKKEKG